LKNEEGDKMLKTAVLIVMIKSYGAGYTIQIEYNSLSDCEAAIEKVTKQIETKFAPDGLLKKTKAFCIEKHPS